MTLSLSTVSRPSRRPALQIAPLSTYLGVWRQRRDLAALSPAMLRDLGISAQQAQTEAARPFWDLP